jgi:hypothetical protein
MKTGLLSFGRVSVILALLWTLALSGLPPATAQERIDAVTPTPSADPSAALIFIENAGQFPDGARFQVRGGDLSLWLAEDAIWLTVIESASSHDARSHLDRERVGPQLSHEPRKAAAIKLSFPGANPHPRLEAFNRLETHVSFFTGSDPAEWRADVPAWGGVRYVDLYPGIDLELTGAQRRLLPRLATRPGADLSAVRLRVEGATAVVADLAGGALQLSIGAGQAAYLWPLLRAGGSTAKASVHQRGALVFEVIAPFAAEDLKPLSGGGLVPDDDPADLLYGTFLGGSNWDEGYDIAVDASGAVYVTGMTVSADFPVTPGTFDTTYNGGTMFGYDAFLAKLNVAGSALLDYATFLGGSGDEQGRAITVDGGGMAYVTGYTDSSDFPATLGALDTTHNGGYDVFVVKLSAAGSALVYATFLGGSGGDLGHGIAVDGSGAAYVTGYTTSSDFPATLGALDTTHNGGYDAFVVKLSAAGSALVYATFLGGSGGDLGHGIAVDGSGAAYVTGYTTSSDFPTTPGAFDISHNGSDDAFVAKLNVAGSDLDYATFLGGSGDEVGHSIAVDGSGAAYVTGETYSSDFPTTPGAFDTSFNGGYSDAFVARLSPIGSALDYATFLGGSNRYDSGNDVAVDGSGAAYVTGKTDSSDFPTTPDAFDTDFSGISDAFVVKLNLPCPPLAYGTFLGGSNLDGGAGIAMNGTKVAYVTGGTESSDFPTTPGAFDTSYNGSIGDAFVAKLGMGGGGLYFISGRVTYAGDQSIPDVTISAGSAGSAITNANGDYCIGDVITGTYTLTPTLEGHSFDPVTRTLEVPPNATGQDFELVPFRVYLPLVVRNQ